MSGLADVHRSPLGRATIGDQLRRHARTQPGKLAFAAPRVLRGKVAT